VNELRKDPIINRWVIIDKERGRGPNGVHRPKMRPTEEFCAFCPGNESKMPPEILSYRTEGTFPNASGWLLRVVPDKLPVLQIEGELGEQTEGIFEKMNGIGAHELIIETPFHGTTMATLSEMSLAHVLWAYRDRLLDLQRDRRFRYMLISKSHGASNMASFLHSHSQLFALPIVPGHVREEWEGAQNYFSEKGRCAFCDIVTQEVSGGVRVITQSSRFIVLAPFASRVPFETWILPREHQCTFENMPSVDIGLLAGTLKNVLMRMDWALEQPPYEMVLHTSPVHEDSSQFYHWYLELTPRLSPVDIERRMGLAINPTPPEEAAHILRNAVEAREITEWDLFVCHASEDKDSIVRPLVQKMQEKGLTVWYDELSLKLGDSLSRAINKGLSSSRYGLVILSPAFFSKEWPRRELDGLLTQEMQGRKIILPIWHNINFEEVQRHSPILADRLAVSSSEGLDVIIHKLLDAMAESSYPSYARRREKG
jgi:UDPglucose--hexose-1-phosphate uridylyltransferase